MDEFNEDPLLWCVVALLIVVVIVAAIFSMI
jgi:hypothetical protein